MSLTRILITGCKGRMGQAVQRAVESDSAAAVGACVDLGDSLEEALQHCDAVIDFTSHHFSRELVAACVQARKPLVMGTTGHTSEELAQIREAAQVIPFVLAPNFSIGVNTLFWLTRQAARILGEPFDMEVVEMHHRMKTDSPSGTARRLVEILCEESGVSYETDTRHGRVGDVGARTKKEIGVHAMRGGDVVGDHTVIFANIGERIELTHKASSRDTFAAGSVRAAKWLVAQSAGLYDMQDVLGLK
ncbi:MAG: 4-hydroxy-tetrahydrodipicolinate reductase [Roseimicrobium sp.]